MKVLVIGGGGREHALVWKLIASPSVEKVWCAPGNAGIAQDTECVSVDVNDVAAMVALGERLRPDLTVIGPEVPLVNGVGDAFRAKGLPIIGPSKAAAQLEGSKVFAKEFLLRHKIPTAELYGAYDSPGDAYAALCAVDWPVVIKADGLCAGKGVFVAPDPDSATEFIERAMEKGEFGPGGKKILLEEALDGDELSFIVLTDGKSYAPLVPTRDHKRVNDGNNGPNTGGMGAYSTDDLLPEDLRLKVLREIVEPTLEGLTSDAIEYQGFLYIGLMLTKSGPKVLEFNCRLGDPETQAIMARVDFDLGQALQEVAQQQLAPASLAWKRGASACIVISSGGYPGTFESGKVIHGLTDINPENGVKVLHAGTRANDQGQIVTAGGRVLGVTASGPDLDATLDSAYKAVRQISFDGMHYRTDIGRILGQKQVAARP